MENKQNDTPNFITDRDVLGQVKPTNQSGEYLENIDLRQQPLNQNVEYAGLGIRIGAFLLDALIMFFPVSIIESFFIETNINMRFSLSLMLTKVVIGTVLWSLYYGFTESSTSQGTVGKIICKIKVIDKNGNRLTFLKAALRYLTQIISVLPLGFGIWSIATNKHKQAWHDMIVGCYVIKKRPVSLGTLDEGMINS